MIVLGVALSPLILSWMNTPEDVLADSTTYLRIYFIGIIPNLIYNMGAGILRAIGDSRRPLFFLIAGCFTNIVLDLMFVVKFNMEVAGAAWATIISQAVSAALVLLVLTRTSESYKLHIKKLRLDGFLVRRIVEIGLPAGLQSVMYNISNIICNI